MIDQWYGNYWDVDYIYDATRSCNTRYVYVITNHMDGNGRIDVQQLGSGLHYIRIFLWDEQGNLTQGEKWFYVVNTGVCEDYVPPWDTLISPNGEEEFYAGGTCEITWVAGDSSEPGSQGITLQRLYYSPDNGDSWELIDELDGDLRSYTWQIPCDLATSECKVKIVVYDCAGHTATDVSDGTFTIHGVASPTNLTAETIAEDAIALQWQDNKENQVSCFKWE